MSDKPVLPNPVTTDQAFLKLIVERLDLMNALLIDICTHTQRTQQAVEKASNNIIDVETAVQEAKSVNVNFDVQKLAERLNLQRELAAKPSALEDVPKSVGEGRKRTKNETGDTLHLKRESKTSK